jgi:hypothetical protein
MKRMRIFAAAVLLCGFCTGWTVSGQDKTEKKGPNTQKPVKGAKDSDKTKALQDLELASRLIQYGRTNKNAESLLVAAQILHNTPSEKLKVTAAVNGEEKVAAPTKTDNTPKALVAEAKKLSASPAVEALAKATLKILDEEPRGRLGGPGIDAFNIFPNQTRTWNGITFVGGQTAVVDVDMNGVFGVMLLEVRDQFGNLVATDIIPGTYYNVRWTPAWTGPFTVRLTNLDGIAFNCVMRTN